ncbi:hypothetical protein ABPG75_005926 [Micractinium tetrahymenae]
MLLLAACDAAIPLQAFKFSIYVAVPIALTAAVVLRQDVLQAIIKSRSYVVYPPSDVTDEKIQDVSGPLPCLADSTPARAWSAACGKQLRAECCRRAKEPPPSPACSHVACLLACLPACLPACLQLLKKEQARKI